MQKHINKLVVKGYWHQPKIDYNETFVESRFIIGLFHVLLYWVKKNIVMLVFYNSF